ncbi:hypothetical protein [Methylovulum miyakonense]|uniref:hypothetical protein n=1 Tax=Methylovulum miyakonense TaxID=645578 RepID=UPI0003640843|nr:hypothetical protein [Methylovulum miyakonense]
MLTKNRLAILAGLCVATLSANAGTLKKDGWTSSSCGDKPETPDLNFDSIAEFNDSIAAFNAWQREEAATYFECLTKDANADMKKITDSVNAQKKEHDDMVEYLNGQAAEFKKQAEDKKTPPGQ